jgi:hypothetical protein
MLRSVFGLVVPHGHSACVFRVTFSWTLKALLTFEGQISFVKKWAPGLFTAGKAAEEWR